MRRPAPDGAPERTHLEAAARRGSPRAIALLHSPPLPEVLAELWDIFSTLDRMRGQGYAGPAALTPESIWSADRLFRWDLRPHEVEALHLLDLVTRHPEAGEEES